MNTEIKILGLGLAARNPAATGGILLFGLMVLPLLVLVLLPAWLLLKLAETIFSRPKRVLPLLALGCLLWSGMACYDVHAQQSAIVREIEANGSGNISTYTAAGLAQWFSSRPQLALKIARECEPISKASQANWLTSAEGTACYAAAQASPPVNYQADPTIY